jgi:hypothetical protein
LVSDAATLRRVADVIERNRHWAIIFTKQRVAGDVRHVEGAVLHVEEVLDAYEQQRPAP